jgi:hypothetical protein
MYHACEKLEMHTEFFGLKCEDKTPHGRPRREWKNNVRIDFREIGWERVD